MKSQLLIIPFIFGISMIIFYIGYHLDIFNKDATSSQFIRSSSSSSSFSCPPLSSASHTNSSNSSNNSTITKIIHQSWKTHDLPPRFLMWSKTWKKCFPNWQFKLWSNDDNRKFIEKHYPWFISTYDKLPEDINRADAMRYFYMFHYGGIYADLDAECIKPFENLLNNYSMVFGAMEGQYASFITEGYVQNSFFYSRPNNPFWLEVLFEVMKNKNGPPEARTGPILLVNAINEFRKRKENEIKIYPPNYFNPFSWLKNTVPLPKSCKDLNRMSMEEYENCRNHFVNDSYVVQYHSQTWARGKVLRR